MRRKHSEDQISSMPLTLKIANGAKMFVRGFWEAAMIVVLGFGACVVITFLIAVICDVGEEKGQGFTLQPWFRLGVAVAASVAILMSIPAAIFFTGALKKHSVAGGRELLEKTENWFRPTTKDARACIVCGKSSTKMCRSWSDALTDWETCTNCGSCPKSIEQVRYCKQCDTHFCAQCGTGLRMKKHDPPPDYRMGW